MSPARRRPAALRIVIGVALVAAAAVVVLGTGAAALLDADWAGWTPIVVVAGLLAVAGGAVACRLTHTELMVERRRAAADRVAQARAHGELAERRATDHRRQVAGLHLTIDQLQDLLVTTQRRLAEERRRADRATDRMADATRRADAADLRAAEAVVTVAELEQDVTDLQATLAAWEAAHPGAAPVLRSAV